MFIDLLVLVNYLSFVILIVVMFYFKIYVVFYMSFIACSFAFDLFFNLNFKSLQGQNSLLHS
jgi:hypothetical protein